MTEADIDAEESLRVVNQARKHDKEVAVLQAAQIYVEDLDRINAGLDFRSFNWIRLGNFYAIASICYYKQDFSPISDILYDSLCLYLLNHLDTALAERAGGLGTEKFLDADMLAAGSGYDTDRFGNYLHDVAEAVEGIMGRQH